MSYTRKCNGCSAEVTWNEDKEWYEDPIFKGEKHDHKRYEAAVSTAKGQKVDKPRSEYEDTNPEVDVIEGTECKTCKSNGFPNQLIFFNDKVRGKKTNKVIPLSHAEKVNGEWVFHEHKTQDSQKANTTPENAPVKEAERPVSEGSGINEYQLVDILKSFTKQLDAYTLWFENIRPKIDTAIAFINDQSIKKASDESLKTS